MRFLTPRRVVAAAVAAVVLSTSGCAWFRDDARVLLRSNPPTTGLVVDMQYQINSAPNGGSTSNAISMHGINGLSPMELLRTTFDSTDSSSMQSADVMAPDGTVVHALGMDRLTTTVGLTEYLDARAGTYEMIDHLGNRLCGAKVRMTFKPNLLQVIKDDKARRAWDSIAYYSVPCSSFVGPQVTNPTPGATPTPSASPVPSSKLDTKLDIASAKFQALVITQQFTPRVTGKPIFFNRGNSVTIVGGKFANYRGGWWETPAGLINASNLVVDMVRDLDKNGNKWEKFSDTGETGAGQYGGLVYSAGDADTYLTWQRFFLNRQVDYLVNFRAKPQDAWERVLVQPKYNLEWNDWSQNWEALTGTDAPDIDSLVDQNTGLPKNVDNPDANESKTLREVERAGCQNCPNPTLEQILFTNPETKQPLYALTIRGYLGSEKSLFMLGQVPNLSVGDALKRAEAHKQDLGYTNGCPKQRDPKTGEELDKAHQYTPEACANWLREGSLYDMLTRDPSTFGFDVVGQFRVRDNSTYASQCTGSGKDTYCITVPTNRQLNANYLFSDVGAKLYKAWVLLQLLGEVGIRSLGLSYVSGQYDGSGIDFAMAQPNVMNGYYSNLADPANVYANPEMVFGLDARALQLPGILAQAGTILYP